MGDDTVMLCEIIFVGGARDTYIVDTKEFESFLFARDHGDAYYNLTANKVGGLFSGKVVTAYINLTHIAAIVRPA